MGMKSKKESALKGCKIEFRLEEPMKFENCFGTENNVLVVLP
jgi:hypothetical protein